MGNKKAQNAKCPAAAGSRYGGTKPKSKFKNIFNFWFLSLVLHFDI
jgi:hypothetical protein